MLDAIENGRSRGNGQMAANLVEGEDAEAVAQYVAVAVGQDPQAGGEESGGSGEESGGSAEEPGASSDESGTTAEDSESSE